MAVNLSRNTKVYVTTTADDTMTGFSALDTLEVQVLNGYSFNQQAESQAISLSEAGAAPLRGSRSFNTKLNPVDWKFSTYIRPYRDAAGAGGKVTSPENFLWNAMANANVKDTVGTVITATTATAVTPGGTFTVTSTGHGLTVGDVALIEGVAVATQYNQYWKVETVPTASTFTCTNYTKATLAAGATYAAARVYKSALRETTASSTVSFLGSDKNQLYKFGLIFKVDNTMYRVNNCAVDGANINFDLQGIATIDWNGFGTKVLSAAYTNQLASATAVPAAASIYITNKLSTTVLKSTIEGTGTGNKTYSLPITGGSVSVKNNIQYVTPETLGVVNSAIGYFTGNREISGSLTAYLKTASLESGELLSDILGSVATTTEPQFYMELDIGGATAGVAAGTARVNMKMPAVTLQVPSVEVQDVISTTINFKASGYTGIDANSASFNLAIPSDLLVSYFTPTT